MAAEKNDFLDFSRVISALESDNVWELDPKDESECADLAQAVFDALQDPVDFPPLESAILPGDRVAVAVDSNVPAVAQVVLGVTKAIGQSEAGGIDIVLSDEAREDTVDSIRDLVDTDVNVIVHHSSDRDALRYLAADAAADPIYLNRNLVDADLVLPVVVNRRSADDAELDLTGVFPLFADSARCASGAAMLDDRAKAEVGDSAWQLGIHIMLSLTPGNNSLPVRVIAGTPFDANQRQQNLRKTQKSFPESPSLIVVSLDGDAQQQSWSNAARAIAAASQYVEPDGTIVLWSELEMPPTGHLLALSGGSEITQEPAESGDGFPVCDGTLQIAETIRQVASDHRLIIHSRLDREVIEALGLGVIESVEELKHLSATFGTCGVIRAAQFGGVCGQFAARNGSPTEI